MIVFSKFKVFSVIGVCLFCFAVVLSSFLPEKTRSALPSLFQKNVNLGLDLRGGSHLQLEVDINSVTKEHLNTILSETRRILRKNQIKYKNLCIKAEVKPVCLSVHLIDPNDYNSVSKLLKKIEPELDLAISAEGIISASLSEAAVNRRNVGIIEQSIEVVRRRIDASGTKEPEIQRQGQNRIVVQLPGVSDPSEVRRLIGTTAKLSFQWVDDSVQPIVEARGSKVYLPSAPIGSVFMPEERSDGTFIYMAIKRPVIIQGDNLVDAQATFNEHGQPIVSIKFNNIGRQQMAEASENLKKQFAIVLDGKVISAPVFQDRITGGSAQISGHFTVSEAKELALLLRAGALPARLDIVEECTVGPSLGEDSISNGRKATIFAFVIVAVFMLIVYSYLGLFAGFALVTNITMLFAGLSLLGATLTLPGIAGIALTIGMAVDANVLIFERIKEELHSGLRVLMAIDQGYKRAMSAILDSNITTIIGAWILYYFGTGAVKGFAVTLALGVVISMFTALTLTQMLLVTFVRKSKVKTLPL